MWLINILYQQELNYYMLNETIDLICYDGAILIYCNFIFPLNEFSRYIKQYESPRRHIIHKG